MEINWNNYISGYEKLFVSLLTRGEAFSEAAASLNASFHSVPLAMTNVQLILPKYLSGLLTFNL